MDGTEDLLELFRIPWCVGIIVSLLAILIELSCFVTVKHCRKFDEMVLCQMSCARVLNTILEHIILYYNSVASNWMKNLIFIAYYQTDLVLLVWMCLFTKHLYEKIVFVFHVKKYNPYLLSLLAWLLPLPLAVPCPFLLGIGKPYITIYYNVINHLKFFILLGNATSFTKIFFVAFHRDKTTRSVRNYIKSAVVGFLLILITSFQVLVTDLISYCYKLIDSLLLVYVLCVFNSFQVLIILIIFILLVRGRILISSNSRSLRLSYVNSR